MLQDRPRLRRLVLIGTPLLTLILLLFHPRPNPAEMGLTEPLGGMDVYTLLAPVADRFLAVHVLFAPALALLGLSVILLLNGVRGTAARISRVSAFVFVVTYIMYETIIGTVTALLIRGAAALPPDEQAVIGDAVFRNYGDPIWGDGPSVLFLVASLTWPLAVIVAAFALRRSGKPILPCILLGLSFIFTSHASPLGPLGMLLFLLAAVGMERAGSPLVASEENETRPSSYATN
jgi:hypothetical protein